MLDWGNQEIREYYDSNPDVLLSELSRMTGRTVAELKRILMGEHDERTWPNNRP